MADIINEELKNIVEELKNIVTENLKPVVVEPDLELCPDDRPLVDGLYEKLIPTECPQDFEPICIDATTECRRIEFDVVVNNLCKDKKYIVSVLLYKWVWVTLPCPPWRKFTKVPVGQTCKIAKYCGGPLAPPCGSDTVHFELAIEEPVCSHERIYRDIVANYVDICDL
ncbi:hypothetical protein [Clostridium sp.]|uniref:hypothetical protein n=1 Tax=Clostridium sp. TaxID=1506 RepID=UPI0032172958